jgi:hypothetical protein
VGNRQPFVGKWPFYSLTAVQDFFVYKTTEALQKDPKIECHILEIGDLVLQRIDPSIFRFDEQILKLFNF